VKLNINAVVFRRDVVLSAREAMRYSILLRTELEADTPVMADPRANCPQLLMNTC